MEFGVQFFPDVRPEQKSGADYACEALDIAEESDAISASMSGSRVPFCRTSFAASAARRINRLPVSARASSRSSCC
jgi:hypothetical protein